MPNILVRDVPPFVHERLVEEARERGQSLQQYLLSQLRRLAMDPPPRPDSEAFLDRMAALSAEAERLRGHPVADVDAAALIREGRGPLGSDV